jgi:hypothetical protein
METLIRFLAMLGVIISIGFSMVMIAVFIGQHMTDMGDTYL